MGDKRSHRGTPRHWEDPPFEQEIPPPRRPSRTYQQSSPAEETTPLEGTVKWFDPNKGFGFVALQTGGEAFLHVSRLKAAGYNEAPEGSRVLVRTGPGRKGPEVIEVIKIHLDAPQAEQTPRRSSGTDRIPPAHVEETDAVGTVKWFNTS